MNGDDPKRVILLVEDEVVVRNLVRMVLERDGYSVLEAEDGERGLQLSRSFKGPIDLVLSDVRMPHLEGTEMVGVIARERPGIKVLLMSGRTSGAIPREMGASFMHKPFLPIQLSGKIRELLESEGVFREI
jgi:two-component system, cell cycle sensor histidine kinase and response regulator CckA